MKRRYNDLAKDKMGGIKLHLGCGSKKLNGYINIDIVPTEGSDIAMDVTDLSVVPSGSISEIRMDSAFEHFYRYQQEQALGEYHRVLGNEGKLFINHLPNFDVIIDAYLKKEKGIVGEVFDLLNVYRYTHGEPVPRTSPQQLHKDIFNNKSIRLLLEESGFKIEKLENAVYGGEHLALNMNIVAVKA